MEFTRKGLCIWQQHCLCMCTLYEYIHCSAMYSACANVTSLVHFNVSKHSTLAIEAVFIYTMPNLCKQVGVTSHSIAQAAHTLCTQASSISVFSALVLTSQPVPLRNHFGCQSREWYNTLVKKPPCLGSLLEWEKNTTFVPQQHEVCTFCVHTESITQKVHDTLNVTGICNHVIHWTSTGNGRKYALRNSNTIGNNPPSLTPSQLWLLLCLQIDHLKISGSCDTLRVTQTLFGYQLFL